MGTVLMVIFSVLAVELLDEPVRALRETGVYEDCERCERAFGSVSSSVITVVEQALISDNWSTLNTPLLEAYPFSGPFLVGVWMTVNLCVMNLLLSVIVDCAAERREADREYKMQLKVDEFAVAKQTLKRICKEMDTDE